MQNGSLTFFIIPGSRYSRPHSCGFWAMVLNLQEMDQHTLQKRFIGSNE
jgi:hypothetical protein